MTTLQIQTPEWAEPLLQPARYKGAWGGRGSGKSHYFAEMLIEAHILDPNTSSVCVREIQKSLAQSVKRLLELKIHDLGVGDLFEIQEFVIKRRNGSGLILFQGMQNHTNDSIKSLEGFDRAWVEEAQSISQRSLDMLRPTIRKPGSELWFSWNPSSPNDPIDQLLRGDNSPPGAVVVKVNWNDNPWFPEVLRKEMEFDRARDLDKFAHVWGGEYLTRSNARVFRNWRVDEFEAPANAMFRFGADWGFATDPTVLIRCYVEGRTLYIDHEAYQVGCEIVDTPDLFLTVPEAEKWPIVADSSRPETISHMKRNGFPKIMGAVKGPRSVEEGVEFLKSHDIVVHPRCQHVIDELTHYAYKTDPATNAVLPVLEDKHNHCIAEGQLVLTMRGNVPVETVTTDDFVWTRGGWRAVLFAGLTDVDRETVVVETTNGRVVCTPDHEIYTANGFVRADALRYDDDILNVEDSSWLKLLSGTECFGGDIQSQRTKASGSISSESPSFCTAQFGNRFTGTFQKAFTSITLMATRATTRLKTLSASTRKTTQVATHGAQSERSNRHDSLVQFGNLQNRGIAAMKDEQSTEKLALWPTSNLFRFPRIAKRAARFLSRKHLATETSFAAMPASPHGEGQAGKTTSSATVCNAGSHSLPTDTQNPVLVAGRVLTVSHGPKAAKVYDLTVDEFHEFVCGGVLVSNCLDAMRYALEGVRRIQQQKPPKVVILPTANRW